MLSDEEKKAIDNMKDLLLYSKEHEYFSPFQEQEIDDMNIVLNIVEKQSKEIEELKEKNRQGKMRIVQLENEITLRIEDVNQYYIPKDKIKAKIKEYEKQEKDEPDAFLCKRVLQSLLEKE